MNMSISQKSRNIHMNSLLKSLRDERDELLKYFPPDKVDEILISALRVAVSDKNKK